MHRMRNTIKLEIIYNLKFLTRNKIYGMDVVGEMNRRNWGGAGSAGSNALSLQGWTRFSRST